MGNGTLVAGQGLVASRSMRTRAFSVVAAFALVLATLVLVQHRADAAPASSAVVASVAAVGGAVVAQIDIRSIVCPILLSLRNAFATSPFFAFILPTLNALIAGFGCSPS